MYHVTNPATGTTEATFETATDAAVETMLAGAHDARPALRAATPEQRAAWLTRIADLHEQRRDDLALTITREMGKPLAEALDEVDLVVSIYRFYAEIGPVAVAPEPLDTADGVPTVVLREPLGVLLGIMPWNYPYYQVARFVAPNLMLGNAILLKPAPQCPASALAVQEIVEAAGVPQGAYATALVTNEQVATLIADPRLAAVSLTGSERAGAAVAAIAGTHLKKVVLELGGSDPFIVLPGADLDSVVALAVDGRMYNAGQSCNAAKRFIVADSIYDRFAEAFAAQLGALRPGDPQDPATTLGPLSSREAAARLAEQVERATEQGARVVLAGGRVGETAQFTPVVLDSVTPEMDAYHEEMFGPVALLFRAADEADAVRIANDSPYGLGATVHSADLDEARRVAAQLEAGMISLNEAPGSAADLPFGGVKRSGFGRELGRYGMAEFVNLKVMREA
ncbi:NAD-dependent succinate-semialdehyde dehydrogenase [Micrococcales bacterium 31B]|nr:NAD-dependent succinate-semialdehyde dehydrogenase [Micrococcales bacterium 31B]